MKILKDLTFLIPINIEHSDRLRNTKTTLGYLNHHFQTNVIIYQTVLPYQSPLDFLENYQNLSIKHIVENVSIGSPFHKTMYIKKMIDEVSTPVFCIYDIDVILPVESYIECTGNILSKRFDLCLPFPFKEKKQVKVEKSFDRTSFEEDFDLSRVFLTDDHFFEFCEYGHCAFFGTQVYLNHGGENTNFISWGPEDKERIVRYEKLGLNINRLDDFVFHFEHFRTNSSSLHNPFFKSNEALFSFIENMTKEDLIGYYKINRTHD